MKNTLSSLLILLCSYLNAYAQNDEIFPVNSFTLNTDKPEAGKEITFRYTLETPKIFNHGINIDYHLGDGIKTMQIAGLFGGNKTEGKFVVPDSIQAFYVSPIDRLAGRGPYIFQVFKKGRPVKGAFAATARFYGGAFSDIRDTKKALSLFRKEFEANPEQRAKYLLDYYRAGMYNPDGQILQELENTWQDSLSIGISEPFLNHLYEVTLGYGVPELRQKYKYQLLRKFPAGSLAFKEALPTFSTMIAVSYEAEVQKIENNFPELINKGALDETYYRLAGHEFGKGSFHRGEILIKKIQDRKLQSKFYADVSNNLSNHQSNRTLASVYIRKAIELAGDDNPEKYAYLFASGQIHKALGNLESAIADVKASIKPNSNVRTQTRTYIEYLMEAGQYETAMNVATEAIKTQTESPVLETRFLEIYAKLKGSSEGGKAHYDSLININDENFKVNDFQRLGIESIDFNMNDIEGKPFSLSSLKGKSVVLYFFDSQGRTPNYLRNGYFNKVVAKHQSRSDVVFVGIDNTYVDSLNSPSGRAERLARVRKYMERYNVKYKICMDDWVSDIIPRLQHFKLAKQYKGGISQYCIIDKEGIVRYMTRGTQADPEYFYRELKAAMKLTK